ncbi:MAG: GTPase [Calditrichaeota bacterium]|nr:GTPase [Calditrichota bacterium]
MEPVRTLIMGAAGRDFHNFNVHFRNNQNYKVVAFTATQIPNIDGRKYPAELAGKMYPDGIPILPEEELLNVVKSENIEQVIFSYSDISHQSLMAKASKVLAAGADFRLMGVNSSSIQSKKPLISICAVRTGVGKSQTTRYVVKLLKEMGYKVASIRHPMPYGDLAKQAVQRFADYNDLDKHQCTIEEREEYEPHIDNGAIIFAGVDYEAILREAEKEADIILWDGGNNDIPFYHADLKVVLADPHRPGHESTYFPGAVNINMADVVIINKTDTANYDNVQKVRENVLNMNPEAVVVEAASPIFVDEPSVIRGKRVLVVEDGPTLTHGEMSYGAGWVAAKRFGAKEIIDPRPFAVNSIAETYAKYPGTGMVLPAMGYGDEMVKDLEKTINKSDAEIVVIGTPIDLSRVIKINKPSQRVRYELQEIGSPTLAGIIRKKFSK